MVESGVSRKPRERFGALASHGAVLTFAAAVCGVMYYLTVLPAEQENRLLLRKNSKLETKIEGLDALLSSEQDGRKRSEERAGESQEASTSCAGQLGTVQGRLDAKQTEADLAQRQLAQVNAKAREDARLIGELKQQVSSSNGELTRLRQEMAECPKIRKELEESVSHLEERLEIVGNMKADEFMRSVEAIEKHWVELAKSEAVQHDYAPFLSKSKYRLGSKDRIFDEGHPESLENLRRLGALQNHRSFAQVGAGYKPHNPRGRSRGYALSHIGRTMWPLPDSTAEFKTYKKKFDDFLKLAPIWVRMEILDK